MANNNITKQIPLTQGKFAIVDAADYDWLNQWKWYCCNGYALRVPYTNGIRGKAIRMHRLIVGTPDGFDTDHINGDELDNQRCNLRTATHRQNIMNQKPRIGCSSNFKGVCWCKRRKKWQASIKTNGKRKFLGYFYNEADAAHAYNNAAVQLYGEYARINMLAKYN